MDAKEIVARILQGEDMMPEIWARNARVALKLAERTSKNKHDPKGCKTKNCVHGNEAIVQGFIDHAATLQREMVERGWA